MYQNDTEILFPMRVAPDLRDLRGQEWREAIDRACATEDASLDQLALSLVMIRLAGCLACHPDSYRAIRGCTTCATATVRRFRGDDSELEQMVTEAKKEIIEDSQIDLRRSPIEDQSPIEDRSAMVQKPDVAYQRSEGRSFEDSKIDLRRSATTISDRRSISDGRSAD